MTNSKIISEYESVAGEELHTIQGWSSVLGIKCYARKGSHGIECRLWKKIEQKNNDNEYEKDGIVNDYYLCKSFLFPRKDVVEVHN